MGDEPAKRARGAAAGRSGGLFTPTVIGSMPKRTWLYRHPRDSDPPELRARGGQASGVGERVGPGGIALSKVWTAEGDELREWQDDATRTVVSEQLAAGIEIVSDGEQRRNNYQDYLLGMLGGAYDFVKREEKTVRAGRQKLLVPRVVAPIRHPGEPLLTADLAFLREAAAGAPVRMTLPAPLTVTDTTAWEGQYRSQREAAFAYAEAVNAEARLLAAAGCDVVQFDDPAASRYPLEFREWGCAALDRAAEGVQQAGAQSSVHVCYGYPVEGAPRPVGDEYASVVADLGRSTIDVLALEFEGPRLPVSHLRECPSKTVMFGCVHNSVASAVEAPDAVADRLLAAAAELPRGARQVQAAPDCGLQTLAPGRAREKLQTMVRGADIARARWSKDHK